MGTSNVPKPQMAQTENKQTLFDQLHKNGDQNYKSVAIKKIDLSFS